jgi:hypothetical protein
MSGCSCPGVVLVDGRACVVVLNADCSEHGLPAARLPAHPLRKYARGLTRSESGRLHADESIRQVEQRLYGEALG